MKNKVKLTGLLLGALFMVLLACENGKNDDEQPDDSNASDCFTCTNCQGQYANLLNGEYCVDGFDNRADWEAMKVTREGNDGCTCEYN